MKLFGVLLLVVVAVFGVEAQADFPDGNDPAVQLLFSYALNAAERILSAVENISDSPPTLPALQPEVRPPTIFLQPEQNSAKAQQLPAEPKDDDVASSSSSESSSEEKCQSAVNNLYVIVSPAENSVDGAAQVAGQRQTLKRRIALSYTSGTAAGGSSEETVKENRIKYGCGRIESGNDADEEEDFRPIRIEDLDIERLGSIMKSGVKNGLDLYALADVMIEAVAQDVARGRGSRGGESSKNKEVIQSLDRLIDHEGLAQGVKNFEDAEYTNDDDEFDQVGIEASKVKLDTNGGKIEHSIIVQADKIENQLTIEVDQRDSYDNQTNAFWMGAITTLVLMGVVMAFWKLFKKTASKQQVPTHHFLENQKVPTISFA